jgi:hypothetical protein
VTRYLVTVRIAESTRKHGIADEDMLHALRNAIRIAESEDFTMLIGPARDGQLLEVGVLDARGDDPVVIHAMPVRPDLL